MSDRAVYHLHDRVRHPVFGEGTVESVEGPIIRIDFGSERARGHNGYRTLGGHRQLMVDYSPLVYVGRASLLRRLAREVWTEVRIRARRSR